VSEGERPQPLNRYWGSVRRSQRSASTEFAVFGEARIERVDAAVAEVADEQLPAEFTEGRGRESKAPGRIERPFRCDAPQEVSGHVEGVHESMALPCHVVVFSRVLLGVRHVDRSAQILNPEWCVTRRNVRILEKFWNRGNRRER